MSKEVEEGVMMPAGKLNPEQAANMAKYVHGDIREAIRQATIRELEEGGWLRHKENCGVDSMAAGYKCDCGLAQAKGERP